MQPAKKIESNFTAVIIDFETRKKVQRQRTLLNTNEGSPSCFQTDERYHCKDTECSSWSECQKLVAAWMR